MPKNLQSQKQELVRDAIYAAAIELFAAKGFDETTIEEVALAAGVSRRSFFRYYASKDDLLSQSVLNYGVALAEAVRQCPRGTSPLEVLHQTVAAGVRYTDARQAVTRQVVEIASRSSSARQAYMSRMMVVEDALAEAFASRAKKSTRKNLEPRLLSGITIAIVNAAIASWFMREHEDLSTCARHAFQVLTRHLAEPAKQTRPPR